MRIKVNRKMDLVNPETGEVIEAIVYVPRDKDDQFVKVYKLLGSKVLEDLRSLSGEAKLLLWFIAKTLELPVQSDLWIPVTFREVAKDLGTSEVSVKRYFKRLVEKGYLEQYAPRKTVYRVKPEYLYRGSLTRYWEEKLTRRRNPLSLFLDE